MKQKPCAIHPDIAEGIERLNTLYNAQQIPAAIRYLELAMRKHHDSHFAKEAIKMAKLRLQKLITQQACDDEYPY